MARNDVAGNRTTKAIGNAYRAPAVCGQHAPERASNTQCRKDQRTAGPGHKGGGQRDHLVRRGTNVIKALALGADFVFIGRPFLYAATIAEEAGVAVAVQFVANAEYQGAESVHQWLFPGMENNDLGQRRDQQILRCFLEVQLRTPSHC
jgi:hypothetical protein